MMVVARKLLKKALTEHDSVWGSTMSRASGLKFPDTRYRLWQPQASRSLGPFKYGMVFAQ